MFDFEGRSRPEYDDVMTIWTGHDGALYDEDGDGAAAPADPIDMLTGCVTALGPSGYGPDVYGGFYVGEEGSDLGSAFGSIASSIGSALGSSGGGGGGGGGGGAGSVDFGSLFKDVGGTISSAASGETDTGSAVANIFGQVAKAAAPIVSKAASQAITQSQQQAQRTQQAQQSQQAQQAQQKQAPSLPSGGGARAPVAPGGQAGRQTGRQTGGQAKGPRGPSNQDPKARLKMVLNHLAKQYGLPPLTPDKKAPAVTPPVATGWFGAVRGVWTDLAKNVGLATGSDLSVKETQMYLNVVNRQKSPARGGKGLAEDGVLGPKTTAAIRKFQTGNGLPATGVVDEETGAAISYFVAAVSKNPALQKMATVSSANLPGSVTYTPYPMPNTVAQRAVLQSQPRQLYAAVDIGQGWVMYGNCACKWDDAACAARCGGAQPTVAPPSLGTAGDFRAGLQSTSMYSPQTSYTDVYGAWVLPIESWEDSYGEPWRKAY